MPSSKAFKDIKKLVGRINALTRAQRLQAEAFRNRDPNASSEMARLERLKMRFTHQVERRSQQVAPSEKELVNKWLQQQYRSQSPPKPSRPLKPIDGSKGKVVQGKEEKVKKHEGEGTNKKRSAPPSSHPQAQPTDVPIAAKKSPVEFTQAGTKEVQLVTDKARFTETTYHSQDNKQTKVSYSIAGPSLKQDDTRQKVLMEMIYKGFGAGKFQSGLLLKGTEKSLRDTVRAIYALYPDYQGKICVTDGTEVAVLNGKEHKELIARVKEYARSPRIQTLKEEVIRQVNEENDEDSLSTTSPRLH
jgi:hypothetical protein